MSSAAGAALKLVVNTAMITALGALRDTLAVADSVAVDRAVALDTLAAGPLAGAVRRVTATGASWTSTAARCSCSPGRSPSTVPAVVAPGDAAAQAERIFEIIRGVLAAHGASFADVLHVPHLHDQPNLDDLPAYGAVRRRIRRYPKALGRPVNDLGGPIAEIWRGGT